MTDVLVVINSPNFLLAQCFGLTALSCIVLVHSCALINLVSSSRQLLSAKMLKPTIHNLNNSK